MPEPPLLSTRLICRLRVELGAVQEIGTLASGRRRVGPIAGGRVEGPHLQGEVLGGGADWQLVAPPTARLRSSPATHCARATAG